MRTYQQRESLDHAWKYWLTEQDYRLFITITSEKTYSDDQFLRYINNGLYYLNRNIFGRRYKRRGEFIHGFCMFERHVHRKHTIEAYHKNYISESMISNPLHMHLLINDTEEVNNKLGGKDLETVIRKEFGYVMHRTKHGNTYPVFNDAGIDVQNVYEKERLVEYVTKSARFDSDFGFVGIMGADGVIIGGKTH